MERKYATSLKWLSVIGFSRQPARYPTAQKKIKEPRSGHNGVFDTKSQSAITTSSDPKNDGHASPQIEARGVRQRMLHLREKVPCPYRKPHPASSRRQLGDVRAR